MVSPRGGRAEMITIEQKPTGPELNRPEKLESPKKGRKNDGLGGFAKLLAGLVSKKTQPEAAVAKEAGTFRKTAALIEGKEKAIRPAGDKRRQFPLGEDVSVSPLKGKKQKETADKNRQSELDALHFIQLQTDRAAVDKKTGFVSEQVLLKDVSIEQQKNTAERRFPFKNQEKPEIAGEVEARNAGLNSGLNPGLRSKKEVVPPMENDLKTRKTERRRDKIPVEVRDLRTQTGTEAGVIAEQGLKGSEEIRNHMETEIVLDLRSVGEQHEGAAGTENRTQTGGEKFAQILARELNGDLSADIVKQATVILRDGGEGTIRLSLKPESLGKVKIHLEMAENKILGHIVVENEEALRAFEQEIHTLEQAFKDSGFEASLNAALDYRNDGQRWKENDAPRPFFSERLAANYEDVAEPAELFGAYNFGFGLSAVNMLI
jgi:hypothetical protein